MKLLNRFIVRNLFCTSNPQEVGQVALTFQAVHYRDAVGLNQSGTEEGSIFGALGIGVSGRGRRADRQGVPYRSGALAPATIPKGELCRSCGRSPSASKAGGFAQ